MSEINPAVNATAPAAAEPKKRGRKPKVIAPAAAVPVTEAEEAALLAPVDDVVAPPAAIAQAEAAAAEDPLRNHSTRLQTIDHTRCVARTHGPVIVGTRPEDEGANGKFYHEKQCTRKPVPGRELCIACAEKEQTYNASKDGRWYGRLNQPMMEKSYVIGCAWFWKKYPNGLLNDPTTRPTGAVVEAPAPAVVPVPAPAPVPAEPAPKKKGGRPKKAVAPPAEAPVNEVVTNEQPKKRGRPKKTAPAPAPAPAEAPVQEAVLDETVAPITPTYIYGVFEGTCFARDPITNNVYRVDVSKSDPIEQIMRNSYIGRWNTDTGKLDRYAPEHVDEDEE